MTEAGPCIRMRLSSCWMSPPRLWNQPPAGLLQIIVFHEGQIIQQDSHDQLIEEENGKYCELWNAQAQYYNSKRT